MNISPCSARAIELSGAKYGVETPILSRTISGGQCPSKESSFPIMTPPVTAFKLQEISPNPGARSRWMVESPLLQPMLSECEGHSRLLIPTIESHKVDSSKTWRTHSVQPIPPISLPSFKLKPRKSHRLQERDEQCGSKRPRLVSFFEQEIRPISPGTPATDSVSKIIRRSEKFDLKSRFLYPIDKAPELKRSLSLETKIAAPQANHAACFGRFQEETDVRSGNLRFSSSSSAFSVTRSSGRFLEARDDNLSSF